MPSAYRNPSPPLSFNKHTPSSYSHPAPSVFSTNSSQSQYSEMIPPRFATNIHPTSQFSNMNTTFQPQASHPPTPAEQNFALSQTWLWVPHTKCSLVNDPIPNAIYLITLVTWNGYEKRFDLELLSPSSPPNRNSRPEIYRNILEHQLCAPLEASFHNTTSLPLRPREPPRRVPTGLSVGMHGQALGIAVSNVQAPFQHHVHGGSMSGGSEVAYSQYSSGMSPSQQYFGDGQRRRSMNDSDSEGYFSTASSSVSDERIRLSDCGSRSSNPRGGRDGRQKESRGSDDGERGGRREERRGGSDRGRENDSERESGSRKKEGGRKETSKNGKQGASKKKEKSGGSKEKKSSSRPSYSSGSEGGRSPKRK